MGETRSVFFVSLMVLLLQGCVGNKAVYTPPETTSAKAWQTKLPAASSPSKGPAQWWKTFNDPVLTDLMARAAEGSLELKIAYARLMEARARANVAKSQEGVRVDSALSTSRSRSAQDLGGGGVGTRYEAGFDASWEADLFGVDSRYTKAAYADMQAHEEALRDVLSSLYAEVARNYIELRYAQEKLEIAKYA